MMKIIFQSPKSKNKNKKQTPSSDRTCARIVFDYNIHAKKATHNTLHEKTTTQRARSS